MSIPNKSIGKSISKARQKAGLTQAVLSEKVGITEKYMSRIECGRQVPTITVVAKICEALNISADELLSLHKTENINDEIEKVMSDFSVYERKQIAEIIRIIKNIRKIDR